MFSYCFKPLITSAMIASLFVAQFAHVPHVHTDSSIEQQVEHSCRPHVHVNGIGKSKHGHSHAHGHSHNHNHKFATKSKSKNRHRALAYSVDHDQDAVYLVFTAHPRSSRSTLQLQQNQQSDVLPIWLSFKEHVNRPTIGCYSWHPPDNIRHCPIYLLTMSLRC